MFLPKRSYVSGRLQGATLHTTVILIFTGTKKSFLTNTHASERAICGITPPLCHGHKN